MLNVLIITPERSLPPQQASHVTMFTVDGEVGVRTGHAPLVAGLKTGPAMVRDAKGVEHWLALKTGVGMVIRDEVRLYVESAVTAADVNVAEATKRLDAVSRAEAKDALDAQRHADEAAYLRAQLAIAQRRGAAA